MMKILRKAYSTIFCNIQKRSLFFNSITLVVLCTTYFYLPYTMILEFSLLLVYFILLDSIVLAVSYKKRVFYQDMIILNKGNKYKTIYRNNCLRFTARKLIHKNDNSIDKKVAVELRFSKKDINFIHFLIDYCFKTSLFFLFLVFLHIGLSMNINKDISSLSSFYMGLLLFTFMVIGRFLIFTGEIRYIRLSGKKIKPKKSYQKKVIGCYHTYYNQYKENPNVKFTLLLDEINGIIINDYIILNNNVYLNGNLTAILFSDITEYMDQHEICLHHITEKDISLIEMMKYA